MKVRNPQSAIRNRKSAIRNRKQPVLVVDIGNTSVKVALYRSRIGGILRLPTELDDLGRIVAALRGLLKGRDAVDGVIGSVAPAATTLWRQAVDEVCGRDPLLADYRLDWGMPLTYPQPKTLGVDRLANARGALSRHGAPVVAVSCGTALTVDVVHETQGFIGGVIAPGPDMMLACLAEKTALLPRVKPGKIHGAVGKSTRQSMRIGAQVGYRGLVRGILEAVMHDAFGRKTAVPVCATGGNAVSVFRAFPWAVVKVQRDLTLFGLSVLYDLNRRSEASC